MAKKIPSFVLVLVLLAATLVAFRTQASKRPRKAERGYRIEKSFALTLKTNGIAGRLVLLLDKDLKGDYDPLSGGHYVKAALEILSADGRPVERLSLGRPLASLEPSAEIPGTPPWYSLTVDYSAGFGSYSGPATSFVRVADGRLQWLEAKDLTHDKTARVRLVRALKRDWRIVTHGKGDSTEIHTVACLPVKDEKREASSGFKVIFGRFFMKQGLWYYKEKSEPGFWESGGRTSFPKDSRYAF